MAYLFGVFLVSASLISLEIGITRIFSNMIWYHLSFLAISIAMLGFSLGGIFLLLFPRFVDKERKNILPVCSFLFGLLMALGTLYIYYQPEILSFFQALVTRDQASATGALQFVHLFVYFIGLLAIFIAAFVFAGMTISTAISRRADDISRVYFSNLIGSGLGCLLTILLLSVLGAFKAMLVIVLMAVVGSLCFMDRIRKSSAWFYPLNGIILLAVILPLLLVSRDAIFSRSLFTRWDVTDQNRIYRKWNSFSCVDFYKPEKDSDSYYDGNRVSHYYEGLWGLSRKYQGKMLDPIKVIIDSWAITSINKVEADTLDLEIYDYLPTNLAYQIKKRPKILIMGAGGGIDVLSALHYRAQGIRAIEINPAIVEAVQTRFADYAGHIYDRPDVEAIVDEGRHYINKDTDTYDMIQLSGVDTLSGAQASSYSFSESYLYTLNAFEEYLNHLNPDGIVTFLRFEFEQPREVLRLFATAAEALREQGVEDPGKHLMAVHSNILVFANLMVKKSPFTPEEVDQLEKVVQDRGFSMLYAPYRDGNNTFYQFLHSADWEAFYDTYPFRIDPVTDDNPFFFNYTKFSSIFGKPWKQKYYWLYWVGQTILFYGFFLILLLSVIFIFLPLLFYRRRGATIPGKIRFILYFVGLGLGFMLVEILLMQRFTLFLGQPIYSLALVLFCMLVFAGLGSYFTRKIPVRSAKAYLISFGLLILILLAVCFLTDVVFASMLKQDILVRVLVSVLLLAPPSFMMGFPFPLGIRLANQYSKTIVPWGWAINGYASVVGSFLSVVLAIFLGFVNVYFVALGIYGVSGLLLASLSREAGRSV